MGSAAWSGLPAAVLVLGTAVGSSALTGVMQRSSQRGGMITGYAISATAAIAAAVAVQRGAFLLFMGATFLLGLGYGANRLARYTAADLFPAERRATVIGWIVWAATIGAVTGPSLAEPAAALSRQAGFASLVGPYVAAAAAMLAAALVMFAMPGRLALSGLVTEPAASSASAAAASAANSAVRLALSAMTAAQIAMVLPMTMTPLHMQHGGVGLTRIGLVLSAHTLGMFALAPLTGRLTDRVGARRVIAMGTAVLVCACLLGALSTHGGSFLMFASLGLLGLGWNLSFIAGSALLTASASPQARPRLQGLGDTCVWGAGAAAGLLSGVLLHATNFRTLVLLSALISLVPLAIDASDRRSARRG